MLPNGRSQCKFQTRCPTSPSFGCFNSLLKWLLTVVFRRLAWITKQSIQLQKHLHRCRQGCGLSSLMPHRTLIKMQQVEVVPLLEVLPLLCPKNGHVSICSHIFSTAVPGWIFGLLKDDLCSWILKLPYVLRQDVQGQVSEEEDRVRQDNSASDGERSGFPYGHSSVRTARGPPSC